GVFAGDAIDAASTPRLLPLESLDCSLRIRAELAVYLQPCLDHEVEVLLKEDNAGPRGPIAHDGLRDHSGEAEVGIREGVLRARYSSGRSSSGKRDDRAGSERQRQQWHYHAVLPEAHDGFLSRRFRSWQGWLQCPWGFAG